jgi:hypothetical protein
MRQARRAVEGTAAGVHRRTARERGELRGRVRHLFILGALYDLGAAAAD